jgi:hypothetical protein
VKADLAPVNEELQKHGLKPITAELAREEGARWAATQELLRAQDRVGAAAATRERD